MAITSIAAGGEGLGRLDDGRVVFVHRTAPGDVASVEVISSHARWARGRLVEVVEASAARRVPPCPFYTSCGGCSLQHLPEEAQRGAKARFVGDALQRIGGMALDAPEVVPSPRSWRYRNRLSFVVRRDGSAAVAGFHAFAEADRIVDVDGRCLLPEAPIAEAWDRLRAAWGERAAKLPAARELRLTLRATAGGTAVLLVEGGRRGWDAEPLRRACPAFAAVWHRGEQGEWRRVAGDAVHDRWRDDEIEIGGDGFLQVNRQAATVLEDHVVHSAGAPRTAVDAYCGVGLVSRRLARGGAAVVGIEWSAGAVAAARRLAPSSVTFVNAPVEDVLASHLPADVVILNPPRAGVHAAVCEALRRRPPARLVYVSCDPATLARDLRRLGAGFRLSSLRCFDLFPQTSHVETVAVLAAARPS